ncbi:MAG: YdcF family protein [Patescibacteria group bacterium]|jgi:uncharacterized SAM-binding protein YcdF (DUF218 family)
MKKLLHKLPSIILWAMFAVSIIFLLAVFTGFNDILIKPLLYEEAPVKSDVIIVLGGGIVPDLKILPWAVQERMNEADRLFKAGYAKNVIVTGGIVKGQNYTESQFMKAYAVDHGISSSDIIEENRSTSTYENAKNSQAIMKQKGWSTALVVTSDYHLPRACDTFRKFNVNVVCVSAIEPSSFKSNHFRRLTDFFAIMREYLATVYYFVRWGI